MKREENNHLVLTGTNPAVVPVNFNASTVRYPPPQNQAFCQQTYTQNPVCSLSSRQTLQKKHCCEAYLLCLPLGLIGAHHFYLRRPGFGLTYLFTFGLLGVGVIIDLFRIPHLVKEANKKADNPALENTKRLDDAYVLWMPFGLLGFHHFYLRNYKMGVLYMFTFGILGVGWLMDLFLMPYHVRKSNEKKNTDNMKTVSSAYVFGASPLGLLGAHHFYLERPLWGILYIHTLGILGIGWVYDWFRIPLLVKRRNQIYLEGDDGKKYLDDAYILWFPCGLIGLHHFYLNRPGWGLLYLFTLGLFGVGWFIDFFRLPCLVSEYNKTLSGRKIVPSRQGAILSTPSNSYGQNNYQGQYMQSNYGVMGHTVPPQSSLYPSFNNYGYQSTVVYPQQTQPYNSSVYNSPVHEIPENPPPYSAVDSRDTGAGQLPTKHNPS